MEIVTILIWICLALIVLSFGMMLVFGLKNAGATIARESKMVLASFALPVVIFAIAYVVSQDVTSAAIATALAMALSGFVALVISGARSLFT